MIPISTITENKTRRSIVRVILVLIILWLFWSLGDTWLRPTIIKGLGGYTTSEYKETVDTLTIQRDTIYYKYAKLETLVENMQEPIVEYKYKYIDRSKDTSSSTTKGKGSPRIPTIREVDSVYTYSQAITDTLIEGNIRTVINLRNCKIIEQKLNYKPKFPILVKEYITIEKTKETTLSNEKKHLGLGVEVNSMATMGIVGVYQTKNLWQLQAGYHWLHGSSDIDGVNKKAISVSIIKLF